MWQLVQSGWLFAVLTAELQSLKEFRQFLLRCLAATKNKGEHANDKQLECGPMPNVMFALSNTGGSNTGGALCSTP